MSVCYCMVCAYVREDNPRAFLPVEMRKSNNNLSIQLDDSNKCVA